MREEEEESSSSEDENEPEEVSSDRWHDPPAAASPHGDETDPQRGLVEGSSCLVEGGGRGVEGGGRGVEGSGNFEGTGDMTATPRSQQGGLTGGPNKSEEPRAIDNSYIVKTELLQPSAPPIWVTGNGSGSSTPQDSNDAMVSSKVSFCSPYIIRNVLTGSFDSELDRYRKILPTPRSSALRVAHLELESVKHDHFCPARWQALGRPSQSSTTSCRT